MSGVPDYFTTIYMLLP